MAAGLFFVGLFVGGLFGVITMCCFQINRLNAYEHEIEKSTEQKKEE